jgi:hypothetical protein
MCFNLYPLAKANGNEMSIVKHKIASKFIAAPFMGRDKGVLTGFSQIQTWLYIG